MIELITRKLNLGSGAASVLSDKISITSAIESVYDQRHNRTPLALATRPVMGELTVDYLSSDRKITTNNEKRKQQWRQ